MEWGSEPQPSAIEQLLLVVAMLILFLLLAGQDGLMALIFPR